MHGKCGRCVFPVLPDEDSSLSSLLTNQSNFLENWVQLVLFPRISAAEQQRFHKQTNKRTECFV